MPNIAYKNLIRYILLLVIILIIKSCVEPYEIESSYFEDTLVIETTITDENKHQIISLSRTNSINSDNHITENGATVQVIENEEIIYSFIESEDGQYISKTTFKAEFGKTYQLKIITKNGTNYQSSSETITGKSKIDSIYALKEYNNLGDEIISINLDNSDPTGNSKYYRFEYIETGKFSPKEWSWQEVVIDPITTRAILVNKNDHIGWICYRSDTSKVIIQTQTSELSINKLTKFNIRSLNAGNYIMSNRYSILVKQYVQSYDAYNYYKTTNKFSSSENVLVQNQPGFFNGNIINIDNPEELVIGYFEVSSVDEKRLFFNFLDFFDHNQSSEYFVPCIPFSHGDNVYEWELTRDYVLSNDKTYYHSTGEYESAESPGVFISYFLFVSPECGDCRVLGVEEKPEFWID